MHWNNGVNTIPLKWRPRLKVWKSSNNVFDPETMVATSYGWWEYLKKINGKLVFNNHYYSCATLSHQQELKAVLKKLKVKIDVTLDRRDSLGNCDRGWLEEDYRELFGIQFRIENEKLHPVTREKLERQTTTIQARIATLKSLGIKTSRVNLKLIKRDEFKSAKVAWKQRLLERAQKSNANRAAREMKKQLLEGSWTNV